MSRKSIHWVTCAAPDCENVEASSFAWDGLCQDCWWSSELDACGGASSSEARPTWDGECAACGRASIGDLCPKCDPFVKDIG